MTLRSELEKAFADEAYDGGHGSLSEGQFSQLVSRLAEVAGEVFEQAHTPTDDAIRRAKREAWDEADLAHYPLVMAVEQFIDNGGDAWGNLDGPFDRVSALKNPYSKEPEADGGVPGFPNITEALDKLTIRGEDHD